MSLAQCSHPSYHPCTSCADKPRYFSFQSRKRRANGLRASPTNDIKAPQNLVYMRNLDFINPTEPHSSPAFIHVPETRPGVPQICGSRFLPASESCCKRKTCNPKKMLATCIKWASDLDKMGLGILKASPVLFSVFILRELLE
jgi:hypothetical protein